MPYDAILYILYYRDTGRRRQYFIFGGIICRCSKNARNMFLSAILWLKAYTPISMSFNPSRI